MCFEGCEHKLKLLVNVVQSDQRNDHAQDFPRRTCHDSKGCTEYFAACNSQWSFHSSSKGSPEAGSGSREQKQSLQASF